MTVLGPDHELRQGDWLVGVAHIPIMTAEDQADRNELTPNGVAVLTQCCDLAQNYSGSVHVSPVVKLAGTTLSDAQAARSSRYAFVADDMFADLAFAASMSREAANTATLVQRMDSRQRTTFADTISRRFSRFAYPEALVTVLRPLKEKIKEKAPRGGSIGRVLQRVATLRLECEPSWDGTEALTLTLLVIVEPEFLPSVDESTEDPTQEPAPTDLVHAADQILACPLHSERLVGLWRSFAEALRSLVLVGQSRAESGLLQDVEIEVMRADEFTFDRFRRSVDLDLDYLSPPTGES